MGPKMNKRMRKPVILREGKYQKNDVEKLKTSKKTIHILDIYDLQLGEYFQITHPYLFNSPEYDKAQDIYVRSIKEKSFNKQGNWIYFPWNGLLIHTVKEEQYLKLRTNRNKNLITQAEQQVLHNSCIGIIGLSVGSAVAAELVYQGIGSSIKLAEHDNLETTNLNRIKATIFNIGEKKISIAERHLYEIDPYITLISFKDGITTKNLKSFILSTPKPKIIVEVIDDFEMKILLRLEARKKRIPVIMQANLGDSLLIDVERFDLYPKLDLFNGVVGNLPEKILKMPNEDKNKFAVDIVGKKNVPLRALNSVAEIGKSLVGRPQLSSTVAVGSGLIVYLIRQILLGDKTINGRYRIRFDQLFSKPQ